MSLVLHNYFRSSASWRVRIALAHKQLDYEYVSVNLVRAEGDHFSPHYRGINPLHEVPTLVVDGIAIGQSIAIIEYLEERWPEPPLLPVSVAARAQVRQLCEIINSSIHPLQNLRVLKKLDLDFAVGTEGKKRWARHWIDFGFRGLESLLQATGGQYCFGDTLTMADLFLVPQVYNARRFGADLTAYPWIAGLDLRLSELEIFVVSHPSRQPDCPTDA